MVHWGIIAHQGRSSGTDLRWITITIFLPELEFETICIPDKKKKLSHTVNLQSLIPEDIWNLPATNVELSKAVPPLLVKTSKPIIFVYLAQPKSGTDRSWAALRLLCTFTSSGISFQASKRWRAIGMCYVNKNGTSKHGSSASVTAALVYWNGPSPTEHLAQRML